MVNKGIEVLQALEFIKANVELSSPIGQLAFGKYELNKRKFIFVKWMRRLFNCSVYGFVAYHIIKLFL